MDRNELPELVSRPQAAEYLGVTPQALSQMNTRGQGPRYVRVGRSVRYRREDLLAWLDSRVVDTALPTLPATPSEVDIIAQLRSLLAEYETRRSA